MKNKIERYGGKDDPQAILHEMPILGQRQIVHTLNNIILQHGTHQTVRVNTKD